MPGWEVSRHPEWELMYAAGITVREISDRVNHPRSTVHRHLQVREQYIPGLRATHEAALVGRRPNWPTHHWRLRLAELTAFVATTGRAPRRRGTPDGSLYDWLRTQRHEHRDGALHPAKLEALNQAWPDWHPFTDPGGVLPSGSRGGH